MTNRLLSALATVLLVSAGVRLASMIVEPLFPGIVGLLIAVVVLIVALGGPRSPRP